MYRRGHRKCEQQLMNRRASAFRLAIVPSQLMKASIARASRPEVVGGIGGFAGLFDLTPYTRFRKPLLASATDGVGTKVDIARRMDVHNTIGIDLVAMVLDDLVVCGAEPLFLTDYIATGKVVPERIASIVSGIAEGCTRAGAALIGGETAEHPGLLEADEYDVAGAGTGIVDADDVLGAERVRVGDVLIALRSSGLHSNGYSLARHVLFDLAGWKLDRDVDVLGRTLGEELLEPTRIYTLDCLTLTRDPACEVRAFSHITGGGILTTWCGCYPLGYMPLSTAHRGRRSRSSMSLPSWARCPLQSWSARSTWGSGWWRSVRPRVPALRSLGCPSLE